jgi:NADH-quinone oxidoreductase subunit C
VTTGGGEAAGVPTVRTSSPAVPLPAATRRPQGMFGAHDTGDTSGFGGLVRPLPFPASTPRPLPDDDQEAQYAALERAYPQLGDAVERIVVDRGELTLHVRRDHLLGVAAELRDNLELRFELLSGVSGADYPADPTGRRLHAVYHLLSLTHRRRLRLEVSLTVEDPHLPSVTPVYPTADWHERETYDFFGIVFDGHPGLTRIFMPDDWDGHPQRKDYPLGGVPVEYKGAQIPPPDERRSYA